MGSEFLPSLSILWKPTNGGEARLLQSLLSQRWHDERSSSLPLLPVSSRSGSVFHEGICRESERSTNNLSISNEHREKCLEQNKWKSEFRPVFLPNEESQLSSKLCFKLCSITGTTGRSAASHFFRSLSETGRVSAADLSCGAAGQELGWGKGGAAISASSTGL